MSSSTSCMKLATSGGSLWISLSLRPSFRRFSSLKKGCKDRRYRVYKSQFSLLLQQKFLSTPKLNLNMVKVIHQHILHIQALPKNRLLKASHHHIPEHSSLIRQCKPNSKVVDSQTEESTVAAALPNAFTRASLLDMTAFTNIPLCVHLSIS